MGLIPVYYHVLLRGDLQDARSEQVEDASWDEPDRFPGDA
jgi:hypothetical protein